MLTLHPEKLELTRVRAVARQARGPRKSFWERPSCAWLNFEALKGP
jgi:hypothetical protein